MSASQFPCQPYGAALTFSLSAHPIASDTGGREPIEATGKQLTLNKLDNVNYLGKVKCYSDKN